MSADSLRLRRCRPCQVGATTPPSIRPLTDAVVRRKSRPVNPRDPPPVHRAHRGHVPDDPLGQEEAAGGRADAQRACSPAPASARSGACTRRSRRSTRRRFSSTRARACELLFAKNAIGAVLSDDEYNRIVHGIEHDLKTDETVVPDDASSLTETDEPSDDASAASDDKPIDLGKKDAADEPADETDGRRGEGGRRAEEDRRRVRREVAAVREQRGAIRSRRVPRHVRFSQGVPTPCHGRRRADPARGGPRGSTRRWQHRRRAGARAPRASQGARWPSS